MKLRPVNLCYRNISWLQILNLSKEICNNGNDVSGNDRLFTLEPCNSIAKSVIFLNKLTVYDEKAQKNIKLIIKATSVKQFLVH